MTLGWVLAGLLVVAVVGADLVATLVVTWGAPGRWRPTRLFYEFTWLVWSAVGRRIRSVDRQQRWLAAYAPLSLLALLSLWLLGLLVGWGAVWYGLRSDFSGIDGWDDAIYYSGVVLLTIGFGDITSEATFARFLTLAEAATGLASIALVISYLPVLYAAYGAREAKLLTLDLAAGERITPTSLLLAHAPDGDLEHLYAFYDEWERWTAAVLESHAAYPMLAYFRSQHRGQSWITALGVVLDSAVLAVIFLPGAEARSPGQLYRRGRRAIEEISRRLGVAPLDEADFGNRSAFDYAYGLVVAQGLAVHSAEHAWNRRNDLRNSYGRQMQALFDHLVAPPGFWGHASGDELTEPVLPWASTPDDGRDAAGSGDQPA